ncbi:uncharacterized protein LOC106094613 [Stomoxys calcitrans]|uniref:uncharacterized protein LOC106094613 n=1 Tax=Stomoxys calcitrans TaxID=35570 RepID=UPI0027E2F6F1|nr:uncharacterized protein LOC106094613 [Stomoxys calcitrans]
MSGTQTMVSGVKIFQDNYIIKKILECLSLSEQLRLLDVSESFRYVIVNLIWLVKYRTLHLHQTLYETLIDEPAMPLAPGDAVDMAKHDYLGLNRIKQSKVALKVQLCKRFLRSHAPNVKILKVYSEYYDFKGFQGVTLNSIDIFKNILHLSYHKLVVTNEQLALLSQHCRQLRRVEFIECFCEELATLIPGDNLKIENLVNMPRLEALIIQADPSLTAPRNEMECNILWQLLNELQLKCLQLRNITIVDSQWTEGNGAGDFQDIDSSCLQCLDVGYISDEFWHTFTGFLKKLPELRELFIKVANCNTAIKLATVEILSATCQHLQRLSIENCDLHVENFCVFKKLKELSLTGCGGFTFANLQQVMGGLELERFTLINTRVLGVIYHIYVSPSLQSITVDTILFTTISEAFQKSLNKFENLHSLNWLNGDINDNWIIDKCPNLRVLNIPNVYLLRRVVFTMKSLQHLTFTSCKGLSWRFIWILIKNLTLKCLNLQTHDLMNDHKEIPQSTKTTLRMIIIPFGIFQEAETFWLDLLNLNERLKILFYGSHENLLHINFIHNLLRHQHLPQRLRYLKICGFSIDICDLQNKLMDTMQQINGNTSHYRSRNMPFTIEI